MPLSQCFFYGMEENSMVAHGSDILLHAEHQWIRKPLSKIEEDENQQQTLRLSSVCHVSTIKCMSLCSHTETCTHTKIGIKIILLPHPVFNFFYSQNQTLYRESWLRLLHTGKTYHYLGRVCTSLLGDARLSLNQES